MEIRIAIAGNPNSGKTTLFNALTGSNQFVGNWPGVTVEKKEGKPKKYDGVTVVDLPGIYSLSPYTMEEVVARNYLVDERPDAILNIVDGTNIERNLYLTTQLMELGIPVVLAINMMDVVQKRGDEIRIGELSARLGCRVVEISALKETGLTEALDAAIGAAKGTVEVPMHVFSGTVEHALAHIEEAAVHGMPEEQQRWYAVKIFERDEKVLEQVHIDEQTKAHIEKDIQAVESHFDDDAESIIANERYLYIDTVLRPCYTKKYAGRLTMSDKIDRIVTNRYAALPIFAVIMFLVYYISVSTVGAYLTDWANEGVFGEGWQFFGLAVPGIPVLLGKGLTAIGCHEWLQSLILDGMVTGVGAVLGFVPQILVLFFLLGLLEACGYMSRIAFVMDRLFRKFGLSGKSFIPILVGTGCSVPGIMATRTIESDRDRRMSVMTTSFMPCSAKLPVIGLIAATLFADSWWVAPSAYLVGAVAIVLSGLMLKHTKPFEGEPAPFVMEMPPYHMPGIGNVLRSTWDKGWEFIKKAGTIILVASVLVWAGSNLGIVDGKLAFDVSMDIENSFLGLLGGLIAWVFKPLGFGTAKAAVATLLGLVAKEEIVSASEIMGGFIGDMSKLAGYSFLLFNLLCAPCFAAMGAIRREMNSAKWTAFAIGYQCVFAYAVSLCVYQIGSAIGGNPNVFGLIASAIALGVMMFLLLFKAGKRSKTKQ